MKKIFLLLFSLSLILITADASAKAYKLGYTGGGSGDTPPGPDPKFRCNSDADCSAGQFCNTSTHRCINSDGAKCTKDEQCPNNYACIKFKCTDSIKQCEDQGLKANMLDDHRAECYQCDSDRDCRGNGNETLCNPLSKTCVECLSNSDCEGTDLMDPYCSSTNECKPTECQAEHCNLCKTGEPFQCTDDGCAEGYVSINGVCEPCSEHTTIEGGSCVGACTKVNDKVTCYPDSVACDEDFYEYEVSSNSCKPEICLSGKIFTMSYGCVDPCEALTYNGTSQGGTWASNGTSCVYTPASTLWNPLLEEVQEFILDDDVIHERITTGGTTGGSTGGGSGGGTRQLEQRYEADSPYTLEKWTSERNYDNLSLR